MNIQRDASIGIFDSGIGGLTVLKEVRKKLPGENIIYLGDTARVPYGIRSEKTVLKYSIITSEFLIKQNIKLLVIACNTASAVATKELHNRYTIPIIDVVNPGAECAVAVTKNKKVGIIGTIGTIHSGSYQNAIQTLNRDIETYAKPCPLFVPLAEEGWCDEQDEVVRAVGHRYLDELKQTDIDTLVLGCTHYPILKQAIQHVMGQSITLIDSAEQTATKVDRLLRELDLAREPHNNGTCTFYLTDVPKRFIEIGGRFLGEPLENVHVVDM